MTRAPQTHSIVASMEAYAGDAHLRGLIEELSRAARAYDVVRVPRAAGALCTAFAARVARFQGQHEQLDQREARALRNLMAHARETVRAEAAALAARRREEAAEGARRAAYRRAQVNGKPA